MRTILIVDDEPDIGEVLQAFLELHGYRVVVSLDGRDALRKAIENPPDLIVTDMMMPKMDGLELIDSLRAVPALRNVPVIAMSAVQRDLDLPFFRKPFGPFELLTEIRRLLHEPNE